MIRRSVLVKCLIGLVLFTCVGVAFATIQGRKRLYQLTLQGWQLSEKDGQIGLAETKPVKWHADSPTIRNEQGLFVSGDPDGKQPTVHLVKDIGPQVQWAFEFIEKIEAPKVGKGEFPKILDGNSGFRFKMKLSEGPYKNWYVAVDDLTPEAKEDPKKKPTWRPLKLVKDPKAAAVLEYIETNYFPG